MTQPASKIGPVSFGGFERFGNSAQGIFETLEDIQKSSKGCAEWIDNLATAGGIQPAFAHDHRGGVWGRPLGVGHCVPVRPGGQTTLEAITFLNVPDVRSPNGEDLPTVESNGGYQYVDLYVYHNAVAGVQSIRVRTSVWNNGVWSAPNETTLNFTALGGGAAWTQATSFQAPAGLVRVELFNVSTILDWEWSSFVIPQR